MNRREFIKWTGRLLAAIPFVALTDLETETRPTEIPFKLVPADDSVYALPVMPTGTSTANVVGAIISDSIEWGHSPAFQFWHDARVLGSGKLEDLPIIHYGNVIGSGE